MKAKYFTGLWPWGGESALLNNWAKYFLVALSNGEYPLWDPFHFWGCQDDYVIINYGQLNPFLYIALLFYKLGVSFSVAFFFYCIAYYGFGLLGFYCLAKLILKNTVLAFWAYLLVLFSSLGVGWFMQHNIFLSLAPIPWFFYFLFEFIRTGQKKYAFGLIFCSTLIATTYVPTYFIIIMTAFLLACGLFCFSKLKSSVIRLCEMSLKHKSIILLGILTVGLCLVPRINWYIATQDEQYIFNVRANPSSEKHAAAVDIHAANLGSMASEYTLPELFADLDIGTTQFYYISIFVYLIILMSLRNTATIVSKILLFMFMFVFLYVLADVTPFHEVIFYFVPMAKYARNYFFLGSLLGALLAIFAMEHLKQLWALNVTKRRDKIQWVSYAVLVHLAALAYLLYEDFVITSSHSAVILSLCAFLVIWLWGKREYAQKLFMIIVTAAIVIQPLEVNYYADQKKLEIAPRPEPHPSPQFSYTRPQKDVPYTYCGLLSLHKDMQDLSGYSNEFYYGVQWSYVLSKSVSEETFANYSQYKFILYDQVTDVDEAAVDLKQLESRLTNLDNTAFVFSPRSVQNIIQRQGVPAKAQPILGDSENFKMLNFKLNAVRFITDFDVPKFLVYNDSYHKSWRVSINGVPAVLFRANMAFKGVWLPAGKNIVEFRYGPVWMPWFYSLIIVYFLLFSLFTLKVFIDSWFVKRNQHSGIEI